MTTPPAEQPRPTWLRDEAVIAGRFLILTAAALVAVWLALQVKFVTVAIFLAFAQAALLWPLVQVLSKVLPRAVAALLVLTLYVAGIVRLIVFIGQEMINSLPTLLEAVIGSITEANEWALERGWELPPEFIANLQQQAQDRAASLFSGLSEAAFSVLGVAGQGITVVLVATFATLFALVGGERLTTGIVKMVPEARRKSVYTSLRDSVTTARWWFIASTVTGAVDGLFIGLGMHWLGIPLAVPIGLATFILGFIPLVGATVAGIVAVLVALFFGGVQTAVYTLILVLAVQQIESNVLAPLLLSRAMQFPPLVTLLTSMLGGAALGLAGLFLAVPVAGIVTAGVRGWRRALRDEATIHLPTEKPDEHPLVDRVTEKVAQAAPVVWQWTGPIRHPLRGLRNSGKDDLVEAETPEQPAPAVDPEEPRAGQPGELYDQDAVEQDQQARPER